MKNLRNDPGPLENLAGRVEKVYQKRVFNEVQVYYFPSPAHCSCQTIDFEVSDDYNSTYRFRFQVDLRAPQYSFDPCCEFEWVEWLRKIIVRADLQSNDPLTIVIESAEHDDGQTRMSADVPQQF